jgi:hypothetical protein
MEFSTLAIIIFGFLAIVIIACTIILYPELREVVKEFKKD